MDVAVDDATQPEDLSELATGAEHELDLSHAEAKRLQGTRQWERRWKPDRGLVERGTSRRR
jgi:hypothetical protein